jgi:hypothetical protein
MLWLPLYRSSIRRSPVTHGDYYKRLMQEKLTHALRSIGSPINENTNSLTCKCWNCHHACYCNLHCQHTTTSNVNNPPTPPYYLCGPRLWTPSKCLMVDSFKTDNAFVGASARPSSVRMNFMTIFPPSTHSQMK